MRSCGGLLSKRRRHPRTRIVAVHFCCLLCNASSIQDKVEISTPVNSGIQREDPDGDGYAEKRHWYERSLQSNRENENPTRWPMRSPGVELKGDVDLILPFPYTNLLQEYLASKVEHIARSRSEIMAEWSINKCCSSNSASASRIHSSPWPCPGRLLAGSSKVPP